MTIEWPIYIVEMNVIETKKKKKIEKYLTYNI